MITFYDACKHKTTIRFNPPNFPLHWGFADVFAGFTNYRPLIRRTLLAVITDEPPGRDGGLVHQPVLGGAPQHPVPHTQVQVFQLPTGRSHPYIIVNIIFYLIHIVQYFLKIKIRRIEITLHTYRTKFDVIHPPPKKKNHIWRRTQKFNGLEIRILYKWIGKREKLHVWVINQTRIIFFMNFIHADKNVQFEF